VCATEKFVLASTALGICWQP